MFGLEPHPATTKLRLFFGSYQASVITTLSSYRFLAAACLLVYAECGEVVACVVENLVAMVAAGHTVAW